MPELPEVETTVRSLNRALKDLRIVDVWSSYDSPFYKGKNNIKDVPYFKKFRQAVIGKKFLKAKRRAKNIIINLSGGLSILVHMKMTGHFLFGDYVKKEEAESKKLKVKGWVPKNKIGTLNDLMNRFIRMVFTLSNGKHLAFSDLRRFAKIHLIKTDKLDEDKSLKILGPEPLDKKFSFEKFSDRLMLKPQGKIKQVLMDQSVISGIGNIYSDEILWEAGIHPHSKPKNIPREKLIKVFNVMRKILKIAIKTGGDSASDFRKLDGRPGGYQHFHKAYRRTGKPCQKSGCSGQIVRTKVGGRSAHFCNLHQIEY